jgi:hypothetical protein
MNSFSGLCCRIAPTQKLGGLYAWSSLYTLDINNAGGRPRAEATLENSYRCCFCFRGRLAWTPGRLAWSCDDLMQPLTADEKFE